MKDYRSETIRKYKFHRRDDRPASCRHEDVLSGRGHRRSRSDSGSGGSEEDDNYGHFEGRAGELITDRCTCV